jgi:hypothetical protein
MQKKTNTLLLRPLENDNDARSMRPRGPPKQNDRMLRMSAKGRIPNHKLWIFVVHYDTVQMYSVRLV